MQPTLKWLQFSDTGDNKMIRRFKNNPQGLDRDWPIWHGRDGWYWEDEACMWIGPYDTEQEAKTAEDNRFTKLYLAALETTKQESEITCKICDTPLGIRYVRVGEMGDPEPQAYCSKCKGVGQ